MENAKKGLGGLMARNKKEKNGSIYYDKKIKKFRCTYYAIDNDKLVETRKTKSFITEQEAQAFLTSIECQKGNELYIKNNGIPLNKLIRSIAAKKLKANTIKESQYTRLEYNIKNIEKSPISQKNVEDITSEEIQAFLNTLINYSESTIKKITGLLSQAFSYSLNKGYITKNPMTDIIRPKSKKQEKIVRALTLEEQQEFTNYLMLVPRSNEPFKVAYLLQLYLGLRIGEALALQTFDIDLQRNLININKTLTIDKNSKVIMGDATKTYAGKREIPIPKFIRAEIISQMQSAQDNKDKLLFVDTKNNYMNPQNANRQLKHTLKAMKIEGISTHSLRHTYGTRCIEAGMRAVALQRLMGHTDITITLNTYTSVFNKYKETEIEKVNDYYINNDIIKNNLQNLIEDDVYFSKDYFSRRHRILQQLFLLEQQALKKGILSLNDYQENVNMLKELSKKDKSIDYDDNYLKTESAIQNEYLTEQLLHKQEIEKNEFARL